MKDYKDKRWLNKRELRLKTDEYKCQECKRYGRPKAKATMVHHIIPYAWCKLYNVLLALDLKNLISLCDTCHGKMHNKVDGKLTELGRSWVRRMGEFGLKWLEEYGDDW